MKAYVLRCPNCGGDLTVEDGIDTFFCKYCGYKIVLEGQSDAAYNAKTRIKGMEYNERMVDKQYAHERYKFEEISKREHMKIKESMVITIICIVGIFVMFGIMGIFFGSKKLQSVQQEKELRCLVEEVEECIENGDFDRAYVKAQSIKYTEGWSSEIEEKWDDIRKEVINQIIEAEKKATGSSSHKSESDGWFDGLFK